MNQREDPLRLVAGLQPASLTQLAEDAYARRRPGDLARLLAEPPAPAIPAEPVVPAGQAAPAFAGRRRPAVVRALRGRVLVAAGAGLAAAAVAAAVIIAPPAHHHPAAGPGAQDTAGTGTPGAPAAGARAVLLTAARVAASRPAATGAYWYVRERDFEPTGALFASGHRPKGTRAAKGQQFGASFAATQETWTGAAKSRTIVNENLAFAFASAADKARWRAAGEPKLVNPSGRAGFTGPVTSNYAFGGYSYNIGAIKVSLSGARRLPVTPGKLGALLRHAWNGLSSRQRAATVGLPHPTYGNYLFQVAGALLTGPVTPGTRSAVYGLLAKQPGFTVAARVTDPLGRVGTAVGDGSGTYLIINPATADVLATTSYPVRPGSTIPATRFGTEAYLAMGWTNQLGVTAGA